MKTKRFPFRACILGVLAAGGTSLLPLTTPATPPQMPGYEIVHLGRGHMNRLTIAATIEGKKGLFVVDTGAGAGTFLGAGKYSFLLPGPDRQLPAGVPKTASVNGMTVLVGYARDFHVGNSNLGSLPLRIVPQRLLNSVQMLYQKDEGHDYDGYIGEDILRHCNAIIDTGNLVLFLNIDPARKTDPGRSLVSRGWTRVPMIEYQHNFLVECRLDNARFRLYVDTGAPFTVFDKAAVDSAHVRSVDLPMRAGVVGTRQQDTALIRADQVTIGDFVATNVHMVSQTGLGDSMNTNYNESAPIAGLLGGDILSRNGAIIDIGNKALYLKPPSGARKP